MGDYMVRASAAGGMIRGFAAVTTETVEKARASHDTSPVATAALGRLMTAALMMGYDMKDDRDLLTLKIGCSGPIGGLLVTADRHGHVKGYVNEPSVMLPPNSLGKLDVGGALGQGVLSVIKDIGLKDPYVGQTILVSGEIAEDITYYFASSEQTPSSVGLGVLMNRDNTVRRAGGFLIQLMPGCSEEIAAQLEERISGIEAVTTMLDRGLDPEGILRKLLGSFDLRILSSEPAAFHCGCSKDRVEKALISIGREELSEMIREGRPVELGCHFCGRKYEFTVDELRELVARIDAGRPGK